MATRQALLLLIPLLLSVTLLPAYSQTGEAVVERRTSISEHGLIYVSDKISQISLGNELKIGIPASLHPLMKYFAVDGGVVEGQESAGRYVYYKISPSSDTLVVRQVYAGAIQVRADGSYLATIPSAPMLLNIEYSAEVFIHLPEDAQISNRPQGYSQNGTVLSLKGARPTEGDQPTLSLGFTSTSTQLLTVEKMSITYDLDSKILTVWLRIRNIDSRSLLSVSLNMPDGVRVVEAGDHTGRIGYSLSGSKVTVNIYPERFEVLSGWRYELYVKASIREESNITQLSGNTASLKTFLPINATIESLRIEAVLPKNHAPASTDLFEELYKDAAGRTVVSFLSTNLNPYEPKTLILDIKAEGVPANISQILVVAALILGVFGLISYSGAIPFKGARPRHGIDHSTAQRFLKELSEFRLILEEADEVFGLRRGDMKQIQVQTITSRIRSKYDTIRELLAELKREETALRISRELQNSMGLLGESLKVLGKSLTELQRGEMSRSSYMKIYRAMKGDLREMISAVAESEDAIRSISEKS